VRTTTKNGQQKEEKGLKEKGTGHGKRRGNAQTPRHPIARTRKQGLHEQWRVLVGKSRKRPNNAKKSTRLKVGGLVAVERLCGVTTWLRGIAWGGESKKNSRGRGKLLPGGIKSRKPILF